MKSCFPLESQSHTAHFSWRSWSPLQSEFKETLKVFQMGLRLFITVSVLCTSC
uniref:Uncharacterized protein n=1 Tax=Anguilla anguilla TaxID=7936 RepID=A0A0E9QB45_ANGAN